MRGQVVLLRLENQWTLAAIGAQHSDDEADLRAFCLYADGHMGVVEIANARRGEDVNQWTEPTWPAMAEPKVKLVAEVVQDLAPLPPSLPPMPLLVIFRY